MTPTDAIVKHHAKVFVDKHKDLKDDSDALYTIMDLGDVAICICSSVNGNVTNSFVDLLMSAHDIFRNLSKEVSAISNIDIAPEAFVLYLKCIINNITNPIAVRGINDTIDEIIKEHVTSDTSTANDVEEAFKRNPRALIEYFEAFQKLKVFKSNPDDYETDEERELHNKMLGLYKTLVVK